MRLETNAFYAGRRLPVRFTREGGDSSPPLMWSGVPDGTRSFALVCRDIDAPLGASYHWAIYNIPAKATQLPERYPRRDLGTVPVQAVNDFDERCYTGPCPPPRQPARRYVFRLYAVDVERLPLAAPASAGDVERAAEERALADAELIGTYSR